VFFVPKRQGLDREDVVSTAVPQVRGYYVGNWFDVHATVATIGEYYAKYPTLNYVCANTGLVLNLSKLLDRWWQGATLTASDTYVYSPQAQAGAIELQRDRSYSNVDNQFNGKTFAFDRHVVQLSLTRTIY
jgi:hypothetical protein